MVWQGTTGTPLIWTDTATYQAVAGHPLLSTGFFAGQRPPLVPFVLKLAPSPTAFTAVQSVVAAVAWVVLALAIGRLVAAGWRRLVLQGVVLAFATSTPVTLWNRSVLSESLSLSLLALLVAAVVTTARRVTWPRVTATVVAAVAFAATRDAQIFTVALLGVGAVVVAAVAARRRRPWARRGAVLAAGLVAGAAVMSFTVAHTGRSDQNVYDVLVVRIFPFPDRVAWFAHHGMPEAPAIDALAAATPAPAAPAAKVVGFDPDDRTYARLETWIDDHGDATLFLWLLTHPAYALGEPLRRPEEAYNYAHGDLLFYAAAGRAAAPATPVLWPAWWWLVPLSVLALAAAYETGAWREAPWQVVAALAAVGVVSMLAAWQGDGQEVARHTIEGFAEVRLCVLILAAVAVLRLVPGRRRSRRDAAAPWPDR